MVHVYSGNMKFIFTILVIFLPFLRPTIELTSKYFSECKVTSNVSRLIKFSTRSIDCFSFV